MKKIRAIINTVALGALILNATVASGTTFTVNSQADLGTGVGTSGDLRYCITEVNAIAAGAPHTIVFNISGSAPYIIDLTSDLPAITRAGTIIDATTQPGFSPSYIPVVSITNTSGGTNGIFVNNVPNVEIYGLQIYKFKNGIYISGDAADGFRIGAVNKKNVINRCNSHHVFIESADNGFIQANNIGCDLTGTFGFIPSQSGQFPVGLYFLSGADNNTIGGVAAGEGNLIAGGNQVAVYIGKYATSDPSTGSSNNVFYGNRFGGSGTDMAWWAWAFWIDGNSDNNIIGGILPGQGNDMSYATNGNTANGYGNLVVGVNGSDAVGNVVRGNNMNCAFGFGIVLAGGNGNKGNNNIQAPVIGSQAGNVLNGISASNAIIDLYTGSLCNSVYGKCKGENYITTVNASSGGNWSVDLSAYSLPCGTDITAIATTADGSSPFASCFSFCGTGILPPVALFQSSDSNFCAYNCIKFTDNSTNNPTSWKWSFPGATPATSNDKNPQVCYETAGTYPVTLIASNAGGSDTLTLSNLITVKEAPPVPAITQSHDTLFCKTDPAYTSYQWFSNNAPLSGATSSYYVFPQSGNYNVQVTNENGCSVASGINIVLDLQNYVNDRNLSLFPNPATNQLLIHTPLHRSEVITVSVVNILGETMFSCLPLTATEGEVIDISKIPNGIYFVQVVSKSGRWVGRFVKE